MGGCFAKPEQRKERQISSRRTTPVTSRSTSKWSSRGAPVHSSIDSFFDLGEDAAKATDAQILPLPNLKEFAFSDLKAATRNFRPDTVLGEGGFGRVFRGWLDERTFAPSKAGAGMAIAVKKLNKESLQGCREWQCEINFLGRLSHPNLVKLLGYCYDEEELLLVYEHIQKGSLDNHLFRRSNAFEPLSWRVRVKIVVGAARGLAFLHSSKKQVIYRDFKTSNVLLDSNYNAKISDFGLMTNGPVGSKSHISTRIMGTHGYAAPEYVATGHLYVKSDVYGFGVVLLEMLTGHRAVDSTRPSLQHNLVDWCRPWLGDRRKVLTLIDQRLHGKFPSKAVVRAARLIARCLEQEPRNRPHMREVVDELEHIETMSKEVTEKGKETPSPSLLVGETAITTTTTTTTKVPGLTYARRQAELQVKHVSIADHLDYSHPQRGGLTNLVAEGLA